MPDLGTKYECNNCGTKFYDLGKPEPICPKCGTLFVLGEVSSAATAKTARKRRKPEAVSRPVAAEEETADDLAFTPDDDVVVEPEDLDDEDIEDFGDAEEDSEEEIDDDEP